MGLFSAKEKSLTFLREEGILRVPFFQRRYVWSEENWDELYDNFFSSDIPGFLGSIILKNKKQRKAGEKNEVSIIDGQQRLTTLSIFIVALYDTLKEEDKDSFKFNVQQTLYNNVRGNIFVPKIIHSKLDKTSFNKIMNFENLNKIPENYDKEDKILACYKYFVEKIKETDYEKRKRLLRLLVDSQIEILVVINIEEEADEQKVFDTLNNAGVKLTMADTIKNYLFNKINYIYENSISDSDKLFIEKDIEEDFGKEVIDLYNQTWNQAFSSTKEYDKKWNSEFITGRIKRTHLDMFLHSYATIKNFYDPTQTLNDLPKVYKQKIDNFNTLDEAKEFLNQMTRYSEIYYKNFIITPEKYQYDKNNVIQRLVFFENSFDIKSLNPYVLYLLYKYKDDPTKLNIKLHQIEKILMITYLNKNTTRSKNYNKLCVDFINNESRIDREIEELEDPDTCKVGLKSLNNEQAKSLLFLIELYRRRDSMHDISSLEFDPNYQLEHIMPVKWEKNWYDVPLKDEDDNGNKLENIEMQNEYRISKIKELGNMTILKGKLNNKISNNSMDIKIYGDDENKGISEFADLLITSEDIVNYYEKNNIWDEKCISDRTNKLFNEIKEGFLY